MKEQEAKISDSQIVIKHLGYLDEKALVKKNMRNYQLLLEDVKEPYADALTWFHLINCVCVLGGEENYIKVIKMIDETLEKFNLEHTDPLLPHMWLMRGDICRNCGQIMAAKQSLHKAYDEWKDPAAATDLADIYRDEKNYRKMIEILTPIYEMKEFKRTNMPADFETIEYKMLFNLGEANLRLSQEAHERKEMDIAQKFMKKAEQHYREANSMTPNDILTIDRICLILRMTGRRNEASHITVTAVNKFPNYYAGWNNLAQVEMMENRFETAKLFLKEALRHNPKHVEALHNLDQIEKMEKRKEVKDV